MFEHELARSVLLERSFEVNSPEIRFRKEWQALRANEARITKADARVRKAEARIRDLGAEQHPVDRFIKGLDRAA